MVFDTTANLISGSIVDQKTGTPIPGATISLFDVEHHLYTNTNDKGEFRFIENLEHGHWNLLVKHPDYVCMYIVNVIQTGGQVVRIKLEKK